MTADDWLPKGWRRLTIQGQAMVDCGEHGVRPLADAFVLRDLLTTTSKRPGR